MTPGPVLTAVEDVKIVYQYVRKIGLVLVALICAVGWMATYTGGRVGADRFTGTDMDEYKVEHARDVAIIVAREKAEQAETNALLLEAVQQIREHLAAQDAKTDTRLESIERIVGRIEKKVYNGYGG